jgi:ubiquitin-protein ligase
MGCTNSSNISKTTVQVEETSRKFSEHELKKTSFPSVKLVGGGRINKSIKTQEEVKKWLSEPVGGLSIEQLISILYSYYSSEITYDGNLLNEIEAISHSFTANSLRKKHSTTKQYSGIGYSAGSSEKYIKEQQRQTNIEKLMIIIKQKFDYFLALVDRLIGSKGSVELPSKKYTVIEFGSKFTLEIMTRFAQWVCDSPLLPILHRNIQQMASGDFIREVASIIINFEIVLQLELIFRKCLLLLPGSTAVPGCPGPFGKAYQAVDKQVEHYFEEIYSRLFHWSTLGVFSDLSKVKWFNALRKLSDYWRIRTEKEEQQNHRLLNQSLTCSSNDKAQHSVKKQEKRDQVIYVSSGIEEIHFHYQKNSNSWQPFFSAVHKCNKFFLKELKTLNDCLPEEVTVFVAEEHPNYLIAVFSISNQDSPYFGGMWIFHIMIPESYPAVSPKMQFMTTGYGTVTFNPNLYKCGKICLSLLGTWGGEPWDPKTSNLNQALSSILFLIFTDEPYYNEAGYNSERRLGNRRSLAYNGAIIGNMICYGILDHLIKPHPVKEIYQHIYNYFEGNWESMKVILKNKIEFHSKKYVLSRGKESILADMKSITNTLPQKTEGKTISTSSVGSLQEIFYSIFGWRNGDVDF